MHVYENHVLMALNVVWVQAKQRLEAKRLYFVVEPVKECPPRRVRSGIHVSAKERLESLMLARRSSSDLSILKPAGGWTTTEEEGGAVKRVKVRIPKAELERLVKEGATEAEATQKIAALIMAKQNHQEPRGEEPAAATREVKSRLVSSLYFLRFFFLFVCLFIYSVKTSKYFLNYLAT